MTVTSNEAIPEQAAPERKLKVVPTTRISSDLVAKAKRAKELKAIISAATKELEPINDEFKKVFEKLGGPTLKVRELTDSRNRVVVVLNHGAPNTLDQPFLQKTYPKIAAECTWIHPWDSPSYV